jgi:EAL domain-containing protein (putative c-di-GMP-specific phosphodiesterase class I)
VAVEALLRWQHPDRGLILPADFVDVAEQRNLIRDIGTWVLQTACAQAAVWHRYRPQPRGQRLLPPTRPPGHR